MASIYKSIAVDIPAEKAWDAIRDVGAIHTRLAPGFVVDVQLEEGARVVTFGNGATAKELIVTVDEDDRRLVWSITENTLGLTHHNGVMQVLDDDSGSGTRSRIVWSADLLPDDIAPAIADGMARGLAVAKQTMETG
jgi:hypothetical protein